MKKQNLTKRSALATAVAALLPCAAFGAVEFTVSDLGVIGAGRYTQGLGVNDSGEATGIALTTDNRFHTTFLGKANTLPQALDALLGGTYSQGQDINNLHQVTGLAYRSGDTNYHAFVWQAGLPAQDLGSLEASISLGNSQGLSINDKGQVAGVSSTQNGTAQHAVVWNQVNGTWVAEDLGTLSADGSGDSRANAISGNGVAAGFATVPASRALHAVVWSKSAGKWVAKDLGSIQGNFGSIAGINDAGLVAGASSTVGDSQIHAFLADSNSAVPSLTDLKTLGGGFSEAKAINASGAVVGWSTGPGELSQLAFVWRNGTTGMQDLNGLIDVGTGWQLQQATAISDAGHITGVGMLNGEKHAFLLTPADTTPPVVTPQMTPVTPNGTSGWYITSPNLTWSVTDTETAISNKVGCTNATAIPDTIAQTFSCSATSGGGTTGPVSVTLKIDTVKPAFNAAAGVSANAVDLAGAIVTFANPTLTDATSQPNTATVSCTPASGSTFKLGATTVTCNGSDNAGNAATPASFTVTVTDPSPPVITPTLSGLLGNNGWYRGPVSLSWNVTDGQSAVSSQTGCGLATFATDGAAHTATCNAASSGGPSSVTATAKVDATPPTLTYVSTVLTVEATSAAGAAVNYPAVAVADALSGPATPTANCSPASGATFPLGNSVIQCSASDLAGNPQNGTISVKVVDTTKPSLTVPTPISVTTTDAAGAVVTYAASATDSVSGSLVPSCSTPSGATFPVGVTPVNCSASDAAGNIATASFSVTVTQSPTGPTDTIAPVLTLPAGITATASNGVSTVVTYSATATDNVDGALIPSCSPLSGSTFAVGVTAVTCSAVDAAGNRASGSFNVTVNAPAPPPAGETISVTASQCKAISATSGEWLIQGTTSNVTRNTVQLYSTALVPADLTTGKLGAAVPVNAKGQWAFQAKPGPACISSISLRTSATGTKKENIAVARR